MNAEDFKKWRETLGMTQHQAADALGVSRSTIARYEAGTGIPKSIQLAMKNVVAGLSKKIQDDVIALVKKMNSPEMKRLVSVGFADESIKSDPVVFQAFLDACAWTVDTGDLFLLLADKYDRETLQAVKDLKESLTFALDRHRTTLKD